MKKISNNFKVQIHAHPQDIAKWSVSVAPSINTPIELSRAINKAKLTLDCSKIPVASDSLIAAKRLTYRVLLAAACGVPSLVESYDSFVDSFVPGVDIETYKDSDDLISKCGELIEDVEKLEIFGNRARAKVIENYSCESRAKMVVYDIKKLIGRYN